ncbi:MAG TPA: LON peptidase substrate-binding domain-containing protein [Bacteroidia bacterium]|nr:LON peptidase substrate-binding domain-containing protein [Bacteroidia bacterium]
MKTNQLTLPMFPLNLVLFPSESTKLYIFEQRYRQMVEDCLRNNASFGIPYVERGHMKNYGSEIRINRILKTYENGSMDILVEGVSLFRLKAFKDILKPKLYGAGLIEPLGNDPKIQLNNLQDALVNYYNTVQDKLIDYDTVTKLKLYSVAADLQLSNPEKYRLITAADQQNHLLNVVNFLLHIVRTEQRLKDRIIEN